MFIRFDNIESIRSNNAGTTPSAVLKTPDNVYVIKLSSQREIKGSIDEIDPTKFPSALLEFIFFKIYALKDHASQDLAPKVKLCLIDKDITWDLLKDKFDYLTPADVRKELLILRLEKLLLEHVNNLSIIPTLRNILAKTISEQFKENINTLLLLGQLKCHLIQFEAEEALTEESRKIIQDELQALLKNVLELDENDLSFPSIKEEILKNELQPSLAAAEYAGKYLTICTEFIEGYTPSIINESTLKETLPHESFQGCERYDLKNQGEIAATALVLGDGDWLGASFTNIVFKEDVENTCLVAKICDVNLSMTLPLTTNAQAVNGDRKRYIQFASVLMEEAEKVITPNKICFEKLPERIQKEFISRLVFLEEKYRDGTIKELVSKAAKKFYGLSEISCFSLFEPKRVVDLSADLITEFMAYFQTSLARSLRQYATEVETCKLNKQSLTHNFGRSY